MLVPRARRHPNVCPHCGTNVVDLFAKPLFCEECGKPFWGLVCKWCGKGDCWDRGQIEKCAGMSGGGGGKGGGGKGFGGGRGGKGWGGNMDMGVTMQTFQQMKGGGGTGRGGKSGGGKWKVEEATGGSRWGSKSGGDNDLGWCDP